MPPLGVVMLSSSGTGLDPPLGDVIPPHGAVMELGVAGDAGAAAEGLPLPQGEVGCLGDALEFRIRTVSIATCCDLYEFERTAEKTDLRCAALAHPCACCLRLLPAPVAYTGLRCLKIRTKNVARSWVSQFSWRGLNLLQLLPSSARHLPGSMLMTPLG